MSDPPAPPQLLGGRYALSQTVRRGAQATVTQAFDTQSSRLVAIKRVQLRHTDHRAQESVFREVASLQDLKHPNIVELIDVERDQHGEWYLVLEWIDENLEDVILRQGARSWTEYWNDIGKPLLDGIVFAQKRKIVHRDIKPKNVLITHTGAPKLADYGIAKLVNTADAWAPVQGETFRFDHTPGYTPAQPDDPQHAFSRDCFAFAAVAISCVTGRIHTSANDLLSSLQEAPLPQDIRALLERCLNNNAAERPPLASVVASEIDRAHEEASRSAGSAPLFHLLLARGTATRLESQFQIEGDAGVERFVLGELAEASALLLPEGFSISDEFTSADLIGVTWRFKVRPAGLRSECLEIYQVSEVGAALASDLRDRCLPRPMKFSVGRPRDADLASQEVRLLIADCAQYQADQAREREAQASRRIFRVWRSYLRDRADLEARRSNAIDYVDRRVLDDKAVFTTEIAQTDELVGQERVAENSGVRVVGVVSSVLFNQLVLDVVSGNPRRLARRGMLAINTLAAQRALDHQSAALDAVFYDRAVNSDLRSIILDPASARPVMPVAGFTPSDAELDTDKRRVLAMALGVQDVLAVEGPPGTGKTKLITELVIQWLTRHPTHRILLSSQTHIALDNVLERVAALDPTLDMIRIGRADEPRISEFSRGLLLERRIEAWILGVRRAAEDEMSRWAAEQGVDRQAVAVGMKTERLLKLLAQKEQLRTFIAQQEAEREAVGRADSSADSPLDPDEVDEETTQIDSEIGEAKQALRALSSDETGLRAEMRAMGGYAVDLSRSSEPAELAEWADHFLADEPLVKACRDRLALLEDWQLRIGRSADFNAALLSSSRLIAGTCVGIAGVRGMEEVAYDLCIVDEASKATATEILIPMSRSRRWILVGDPKQLPPFFEDFGEELVAEFGDQEVRATLLDRFLATDSGLPTGCRGALTNQYRMIKPIGDLISQCFYSGRLQSPVESHGLKLSAAIQKPVTWFSTHRVLGHSETAEGQTYLNTAEVSVVRNILRRLQFVAQAQKQKISVAVIAGYTAQVRALLDMSSQGIAEWKDLELSCNTVDAFQGRQADVCIYSVVRSNVQGNLGFLREPPRLNVALSRGKSALAIVGDFPFLRQVRGKNPFKPIIDYIDTHGDTCLVESAE